MGVQLSPLSELHDMSDTDPAATFGYAAAELNRFGLAYLHIFEPIEREPTDQRLTPMLRARFRGTLIANGGYTKAQGDLIVATGGADLVSFGRPFIANPDLPARFASGAAVAESDRATFYGGGARGYTDYPAMATMKSSE